MKKGKKKPSYKKFASMLDELYFNINDLYHDYDKGAIDAEECIGLLLNMVNNNREYLKSKYGYKV